jgi:hypothetical protein
LGNGYILIHIDEPFCVYVCVGPAFSYVAVRLEGTGICSTSVIHLQDQSYHYLSHPESAVSHGYH